MEIDEPFPEKSKVTIKRCCGPGGVWEGEEDKCLKLPDGKPGGPWKEGWHCGPDDSWLGVIWTVCCVDVGAGYHLKGDVDGRQLSLAVDGDLLQKADQ